MPVIKGTISEEEIYANKIEETPQARLLAYDPTNAKIVGVYELGKSHEFEMTVDIESDRLNELIIMWECSARTVVNQLHPKITSVK
jgi:hypothetical protein